MMLLVMAPAEPADIEWLGVVVVVCVDVAIGAADFAGLADQSTSPDRPNYKVHCAEALGCPSFFANTLKAFIFSGAEASR
jgi:hypothetical protein